MNQGHKTPEQTGHIDWNEPKIAWEKWFKNSILIHQKKNKFKTYLPCQFWYSLKQNKDLLSTVEY